VPRFIVNGKAEPNGDHEVHVTPQQRDDCNYPARENQVPLGLHLTCRGAVGLAELRGYKANGCYWCARECHTG